MKRKEPISEAVQSAAFTFYTKYTGVPSWAVEEFAAGVERIVAKRCAELADEADNADGWQVASKWIKAEFLLR
jgi:hypothetical protein